MRQKSTHAGALTLVECLLAMAILGMAVAAFSQAFFTGQMQTHDALHRRRAVELAEALMDEILSLPYCDAQDETCGDSGPGPEAGETNRASFDNVDDFHGFSESAGSLADAAGTAYDALYQDFQRSVTVTTGNVSVTGFADPIPGDTVTVTVQDTAGASWTITRFVAQPQE